jgi:hypothetical protein
MGVAVEFEPKEMELGGVEWINLAYDREKWSEFLNMEINLIIPLIAGRMV